MTRRRRLADDSVHDLDWQADEYRRRMGDAAADRQELAAKEEQGACTCPSGKGRTIKLRGVFRTVHKPGCPKWRLWHDEVWAEAEERAKAARGFTESYDQGSQGSRDGGPDE